MTTLFKLAAVAVFAVSASAEAGLYQCDALGNPSRIDQCYARELRTMTTDIHLFYTGMDYARTNITGPEIRYLLDNNGWPAYRAAKCNGDVRCEYDLFAVAVGLEKGLQVVLGAPRLSEYQRLPRGTGRSHLLETNVQRRD